MRRVAGGLLPIMDPLFNVREACKQAVLLEDHLNQPRKRCPDCIRKHFLTLEALFEEAVSLSPGECPWAAYAEWMRSLAGQWGAGADPCFVARELRKIRKELTPQCFDTSLRAAGSRGAERVAARYLSGRHVCAAANPLEVLQRWLFDRLRDLDADADTPYWSAVSRRIPELAELLRNVNDYLTGGKPVGANPPWEKYAREILDLETVVVYVSDGAGSRYVVSIHEAPHALRPGRLAPEVAARWELADL